MNKNLLLLVLLFVGMTAFSQKAKTETPAPAPAPVVEAPPAPKVAPVVASSSTGRPKNPFEIGISGGLHMIWGDVNSNLKFNLDNSTWGLHVRKAITNQYSMRLQYNYGMATMRDNALRNSYNLNTTVPVFGKDQWFVSSRAYSHMISLDQIITIGNSNVYKPASKWTIDLFAGPSLVAYRTRLDAGSGSGTSHNYNAAIAAFNTHRDINIADGGRKAQNEAGLILDNVFDGEYETDAIKKNKTFGTYSLTAGISFGASINRIINDKFSMSLEQRGVYLFDDYIDGERWASNSYAANPQFSQANDIITNTTLKLNYFIGKKGDKPLYWRNSYDEVNKKLAGMNPKKAINEAMADDDADGVPNILDQESASREGCPVDTKGIMLDSDKDGLLDCDDKEPYSQAGYPIDNNGVAKVPPPACCAELKAAAVVPPVVKSNTDNASCAESTLPSVSFDKDKFGLNSAMVPALQTIGDKMQKCPDMRVVVNGINDKNNKNGKFNEQISYNRAMEVANYLVEKFGISRDRFIVRYNLEGTGDQNADRAVMFRNAQEGESGANNPPSPHPGLKAGNK
jgi:outer membrane protein OmpA-like peptidoglycan-associated protein